MKSSLVSFVDVFLFRHRTIQPVGEEAGTSEHGMRTEAPPTVDAQFVFRPFFVSTVPVRREVTVVLPRFQVERLSKEPYWYAMRKKKV